MKIASLFLAILLSTFLLLVNLCYATLENVAEFNPGQCTFTYLCRVYDVALESNFEKVKN